MANGYPWTAGVSMAAKRKRIKKKKVPRKSYYGDAIKNTTSVSSCGGPQI